MAGVKRGRGARQAKLSSAIKVQLKGEISYFPWCNASYYIIKLPNTCDPFSLTGTRQLNNNGKRRVSPMKPTVPLLCRSFYDFRFTVPNICFVKSKGVFFGYLAVRLQGSVLRCSVKLARKIFASVRLVFQKVLHKVQLSFPSYSILNNMRLYHSTE